MFRLYQMMLLLFVAAVQVMNVAVSADVETQQEWGVDQWRSSCNCKDDRNIELFKEFSAFNRELINNCSNKEKRWKSEQMELMSQAAEYKMSLHHQSLELMRRNQSHAEAVAECRNQKLDLSLKLQNIEQELMKQQQKLQDQFIKYEAILEENQISIIDKRSYERITPICKAIYNAKCVGVRCYDVKMAQDMKEINLLKAIVMYDELITKLTPCLNAANVQQLVDEKADIDIILKESLFTAARDGNVEAIRNLIENGVNVNATDESKDRSTALIKAAENNHTEICEILLDAGADANIQNKFGYSALSHAIICNNLNIVQMLIENGAEVNPETDDGITPLHTAARYGYIDIAKVLVEHGARLNVKNDERRTPLGRALFYNQAQMVGYLMSIGATE